MYSRIAHTEDYEDAVADNQRFLARVQKAMDYATKALGHDAWSRDLDDHVPAYALCVPAAVHEDEALCTELEHWLTRVFAIHYISLSTVEWRQTSEDEAFWHSRYEVDWCGSRSRSVNIGPHLYMVFGPLLVGGKGPLDPGAPPALPLWYTGASQPDCYNMNIRTTVVADTEELALHIRRAEVLATVLRVATTNAWLRLSTKSTQIVANYRIWNVEPNNSFVQVGNSGDQEN